MCHEPGSIDVRHLLELVTAPQGQNGRPSARNDSGDATSAQSIRERCRFRHKSAPVWLVDPVLSCRQEMFR